MNHAEDRRRDGDIDQDPGAEGVEHLQRAAREMVAAARSFLDAIEKVVEDRDALREVSASLTGMAATVGDALGDAVRGRSAPWVDSASGRDPSPDRRSTATHDDGTDAASEQGDPDGVVADRVDDTEDWARALVDPQAPRRPSRVRRISVE